MDAVKIGKAISYLRKRAGYTQKDLADRIGISDKAVSKWERGLGLPDISYLRKLSILLDTDTDSLLSGDVIHHANSWRGVLILPANHYGIGADTIIFDKPLVYYLLSYYLLVGIKNILIVCNNKDKNYISDLLGDGSKLGINLVCYAGSLKEALQSNPIDSRNIMLVYGNCLIYGVDQTRFFQKAMIDKDKVKILALPKRGGYLHNRILIDENKKVVNSNSDEPLRTQYDYCDIPILFCPKVILDEIAIENDVASFVLKYTKANELYVEMLDRGFVEITVNRWEDVNEASTFIKIVQEKCGMILYCLEEVAWRRGMINLEQLRSLGEQQLNTDYGRYILDLCERVYI